MRLWSLHPKYLLDARRLVALWREALLAQAVLKGETKGYVHPHPLFRIVRGGVAYREKAVAPVALIEWSKMTVREKKQDVLNLFHPWVAGWFRERVGDPTEIQAKGWTGIADGEHVLITAPTGSGKTLTAFLWAIDRWIQGNVDTGHTSVLYVSPLKALNNDIRRNLLTPLAELKELFEKKNQPFPAIRVMTRSGDTPPSDRRTMQRHPPEILITTPESLNLLLSSAGGRSILTGLDTVILDEIHDVLGNKRGVHLITAVDRLVPLSGEFQRIALSATVKPLETAASFTGGFRMEGSGENPRYIPRDVQIIESSPVKSYSIEIRYPERQGDGQDRESIWDPLVRDVKEIIRRNRSTLIFTNSRRLCEKLTLKINHEEAEPVAYAHHGSLSREIRSEVEKKLKAGELRAIVATSTLELGIDIGPLDEVVLIQSPPSISSAIQRVGRAGHRVGGTSRGTFFPTHGQDLLEMAVLARGILAHDMAPVRPVPCPLDVLAQIIVSMTGVETWDMDTLYYRLRTSFPYRNLSRSHFDLVLNMLGGRFAGTRVRELRPRISIDRLDHTVSARRGALMDLYMSGGVIPDRGYFHMRHADNGTLIGDLDEEFVWEARVGQTFSLGTQNWRIERITHSDVFVTGAPAGLLSAPFWRAEGINRDFHFSEHIGRFMEESDLRLEDPDFQDALEGEYCMEREAAGSLLSYLKKQREATGCGLPHRHHLVVEFVSSGPGSAPGNQAVIHTIWGGRVNRPYAMALDAAWEERFGHRLEIFAGNDSIALLLPHETGTNELLSLVTSGNVYSLLQKRLEGSGFFGARFREAAGRALLLTRRKFNERVPLWINRLRSKKLLESVKTYKDFPILFEAWRSCLQDEFDMDALIQVLSEQESGAVQWSETRTSHPSPMAGSVSWRQINEYVYMDDTPSPGKGPGLRSDLMRDLVLTTDLRPVIPRGMIDAFEMKRQRLSPGYSPASDRDLVDWVKERVIIPGDEYEHLADAMLRDHGDIAKEWMASAAEKLIEIRPPRAEKPLIAALERAPAVLYGLYGDIRGIPRKTLSPVGVPDLPGLGEEAADENGEDAFVSILGEWLAYYGSVSAQKIRDILGIDEAALRKGLGDLIEAEKLVSGSLTGEDGEDEVCDRENFEHLLRLSRAEAVPAFEPLDIEALPLFLALHQGIVQPREGMEGLMESLERLLCYPQPAHRWEAETFPARLKGYVPSLLDTLMQREDLQWIGTGDRQVTFCFESDLDLLYEEETEPEDGGADEDNNPVPGGGGRYDFSTLLRLSGLRPRALADRLWQAAWKGEIVSDTFMALRSGLETGFKVPDDAGRFSGRRRDGRMAAGRRAFSRWKKGIPFEGNWFRLLRPRLEQDLLEREERNKDRVRLLLDRYGILFRELLQRESPPFQWASLFRSMRLMEFSGEIFGGYFFKDIPGPQFISHRAFRRLRRVLPDKAVWWVNATDPASPCGLPLRGLKELLPRRIEGNHLVYEGTRLIMISGRKGKALTFFIPPEDPLIPIALTPLHHMLTRSFRPVHRIAVETINGERAPRSVYLDALRTSFDLSIDYRNVVLYRRV